MRPGDGFSAVDDYDPGTARMRRDETSGSSAPIPASTVWEVYLKEGKLFVKNEGTEYALTRSGEKKFAFGAGNENELVFVPGKNGQIEFVFSELYSAKKVR